MGGRRAHPGLHQRGPARGRPRALRQAAGRPATRTVDRALHRESAQPAAQRGGARPHRRYAAAGGSARRRSGHHPQRRSAHRRRRDRLCAEQQRHPDHRRQVDPRAVVRDHTRLRGPRPRAPVRQYQRSRHRRRRDCRRADREEDGARGRRRRGDGSSPLCGGIAHGRRRSRLQRAGLALGRRREHRSRFPHRHRRCGGPLWAVAVVVRQRRILALLQLLLHGAVLYLHDRGPHQRHRLRILHRRGRHRFQRRGARPHPGAGSDGTGTHHRVAVRVQPQARGRRHARRRAVGAAPTRRH